MEVEPLEQQPQCVIDLCHLVRGAGMPDVTEVRSHRVVGINGTKVLVHPERFRDWEQIVGEALNQQDRQLVRRAFVRSHRVPEVLLPEDGTVSGEPVHDRRPYRRRVVRFGRQPVGVPLEQVIGVVRIRVRAQRWRLANSAEEQGL